jgi:hypothetical protein
MNGFQKFLLVGALAMGGYALLGRSREPVALNPVYQLPYVVLYGRETCGICQGVRRSLDAHKIPYVWRIIDDPAVQAQLYPRMEQAGLNTSHFVLPVVDVNAQMMVSPTPERIIAKYRSGA